MSKIDGKKAERGQGNGNGGKKKKRYREWEISSQPDIRTEPSKREKKKETPKYAVPLEPVQRQPPKGKEILQDGISQEVDRTVNVFEESIFPVPCFFLEVSAVTLISRGSLDIGKIFASYPKDLAILVTPSDGSERFISIVLNRNSKIQDKPVLVSLLACELVRMDQTIKDSDKRWKAKTGDDKNLVSGFTTLPVKSFLEILALCFKKINPENSSEIVIAKDGVTAVVRT